MAKAWEAGRLNGIELEDYTLTAGEMIRHTPPEVIIHRISASARRPTLLAPLWCENRWTGMVEPISPLNEHGVQGSALGRPWGDLQRSRSLRQFRISHTIYNVTVRIGYYWGRLS